MGLADTRNGPCSACGQMAHHKCKVLGGAGHGAANAHDELHMGVAGDAVLIDIVHCGIQMAGVEDLKLGLYVFLYNLFRQLVQEAGAVLEDVAVGPVQGVGVEGAHLGLQGRQMLETLVVLVLAAGGGEVDDDVNALLLAQRTGLFHSLGELLEAHGLVADLHDAVHFLCVPVSKIKAACKLPHDDHVKSVPDDIVPKRAGLLQLLVEIRRAQVRKQVQGLAQL